MAFLYSLATQYLSSPSHARWRPSHWPTGLKELRREYMGWRLGLSCLSTISNYHNCWNLFSLFFSCFSDTKSSLPTCTTSPPENSHETRLLQDRKTERKAEKQRKEEKSTLKICKSSCLGWAALTNIRRIAASILGICMCVCVGIRLSLLRCVMTSLCPGFHVLVRQSACWDMSAEIFSLIETLHKCSCQAELQTEYTTAVERELLGQQCGGVFLFPILNKYSVLNDNRLDSGQSVCLKTLPQIAVDEVVKSSTHVNQVFKKKKKRGKAAM